MGGYFVVSFMPIVITVNACCGQAQVQCFLRCSFYGERDASTLRHTASFAMGLTRQASYLLFYISSVNHF